MKQPEESRNGTEGRFDWHLVVIHVQYTPAHTETLRKLLSHVWLYCWANTQPWDFRLSCDVTRVTIVARNETTPVGCSEIQVVIRGCSIATWDDKYQDLAIEWVAGLFLKKLATSVIICNLDLVSQTFSLSPIAQYLHPEVCLGPSCVRPVELWLMTIKKYRQFWPPPPFLHRAAKINLTGKEGVGIISFYCLKNLQEAQHLLVCVSGI